MPRITASLASSSFVIASPAEYHKLNPSSSRTSARVGRSTPNQRTYFFDTNQKQRPSNP